MNVAVIGSGISAIIVAKTFLEYNHKVYLFDSDNIRKEEKVKNKKKFEFFPKIKKSPKYNNKQLINSINKFKKKNNIKTKNFFLVSSLISGGLSNFWGAGLEFPDAKYLKKYSFSKSIMKEQKYIDRELKIDKKKFNFFNFFFKQTIIKKMLTKKNKSIYFSKFLPAIEQYNKKKLTINDYNNIDLLGSYTKHIYNSKSHLSCLLKNKNFFYIPNTFIENIKKNKTYKLITDNNRKINQSFDKIIISAGTVGSTILADKITNSKETYRLFHTPMFKIMYLDFLLPFKIASKIKFGLPLLNLNIHIKKDKFCGSFMHLNTISNNFFGISKLNFIFSFIKKFIFVGNIFLPSNYSNTFVKVSRSKTLVYSKNSFHEKKLKIKLKEKLNPFLSQFNMVEFFPQNLKLLENGSDAHYTSTLVNKFFQGEKLLNKYCELNKFKNIHIIDGSSIKEGLYYPTYFLMLYARFISKKIIHEKKYKN